MSSAKPPPSNPRRSKSVPTIAPRALPPSPTLMRLPSTPGLRIALSILFGAGIVATLGVALCFGYLILAALRAPADRPAAPAVILVTATLSSSPVNTTVSPSTLTPTPISLPPTPTANPAASPLPTGQPTGKIVYICFVGGYDQVCLINADGSDQRRLTFTEATDFYASLSPDGLTIAFSSRRDNVFEIYLMAADGSNPLRLTADLGGNYAPEISPDGTTIVFTSTANGKQDLYLMNLDGSQPTRLTTHAADDFDPTWSPDGARIAFTSNRTGTDELYVIHADGTGERQVTSGSNQQEGGRLDWSPDGAWLAFYAGPEGDKDLYLLPAGCTTRPAPCGPDTFLRLTFGGNNKAPSFSPDGLWIAFASNLYGDNDIFIMRIDGTDLRQLTFGDGADWQPRWGK